MSKAEGPAPLQNSFPGKGILLQGLLSFLLVANILALALCLCVSQRASVTLAIHLPHQPQPPPEGNVQPSAMFCEMDALCSLVSSSVSCVWACVRALQAHMTTPCAGVYVSPCFLCFTAVHVNKRDIIFLLDGSFTVGKTHFPYVRDFVMAVVNSLDVGSDSIRVGLVQFSDAPVTEFSLNTYQTKSDVLAHLRQLRLQGGAGRNTGSALSYVHAHHFTDAGGSRIRQRVPQLLLLLTAGRSEDSYLQAANALAREGVLTFCVGASQADKTELEHIAFNPSLVYLMDDFSSLPALPQQLIQPLTTYVSGGVEEVPLAQPGNAPPPAPAWGSLSRAPPWRAGGPI